MHRLRPAAERKTLLVTLTLALGAGACIQPNEQSEGNFGTFRGNAVAADDADAGAGGSGNDTAGGNDNAGASAGNTNGSGDGLGATPKDAGASTGASGPGGGSSGQPPTGGDAGAGTTGADAGGATTGVSSLTFSVLTKALGGQYSPRNVGAIWITNGSGAFVKTLKLWANQRLQYLSTFQAQTNRNKVDAVTSATLLFHQTHTVSWNLKDVNGKVVPDGKYNVVIETTDKNGFGDSIAVPFTKTATPTQISPPDATHYVDMSLNLK